MPSYRVMEHWPMEMDPFEESHTPSPRTEMVERKWKSKQMQLSQLRESNFGFFSTMSWNFTPYYHTYKFVIRDLILFVSFWSHQHIAAATWAHVKYAYSSLFTRKSTWKHSYQIRWHTFASSVNIKAVVYHSGFLFAEPPMRCFQGMTRSLNIRRLALVTPSSLC